MGIGRLVCAIAKELLGGACGRGCSRGIDSKFSRRSVGVNVSQLTQFQVRCLLAALAFGAVVSAITLPTSLIFGMLIIPIWATAEAAFFVWWCIIYRRLNAQPIPHRPPQHINPREVFDRFIHDQSAMSQYIDITKMISKWHWDVPISELTRENVADLLCYGFYYRSLQQMVDDGMGDVPDQLVSELEAAWGVQFPVGPSVPRRMMRHLWEPVRCFYRPLAFYVGVEVLIALKHVMLLAAGFRAHMYKGMRYYTYGLPTTAATTTTAGTVAAVVAPTSAPAQQHLRSRTNSASTTSTTTATATATTTATASVGGSDAPILFLHGVGLGVLPYLNFLLRLSSLGRPAVAVEVRHLSMRLCTEVPEEDEVVECIAGALNRHGVRQVHAVAHSYGTFMASRLVQLHRPLVASLTLLDPVCFIMFSGKLIYNFVYRNPLQGASTITWFIARDLAHSVSVSRRFYWSLLNLWPDQLPEHTLVALSAQDELVPVPEVLTMLRQCPSVRVRVHDGHRHADFIKDLPEQARMVQMVAELIEQATTATSMATVNVTAEAEGAAPLSDSALDLSAMAASRCSCQEGDVNHLNHYGVHHNHKSPVTASHVRSDSASSYEAAGVLFPTGLRSGTAECPYWKKMTTKTDDD